jgi:hypothetical protein
MGAAAAARADEEIDGVEDSWSPPRDCATTNRVGKADRLSVLMLPGRQCGKEGPRHITPGSVPSKIDLFQYDRKGDVSGRDIRPSSCAYGCLQLGVRAYEGSGSWPCESNGSSTYWASALLGMDSLSIPTRRASSISATTDQMGPTIRRRMVPRSPSSASRASGARRILPKRYNWPRSRRNYRAIRLRLQRRQIHDDCAARGPRNQRLQHQRLRADSWVLHHYQFARLPRRSPIPMVPRKGTRTKPATYGNQNSKRHLVTGYVVRDHNDRALCPQWVGAVSRQQGRTAWRRAASAIPGRCPRTMGRHMHSPVLPAAPRADVRLRRRCATYCGARAAPRGDGLPRPAARLLFVEERPKLHPESLGYVPQRQDGRVALA